MNKQQFISCCAYLAQCFTIYQKTLGIPRAKIINHPEAFAEFIDMILALTRK